MNHSSRFLPENEVDFLDYSLRVKNARIVKSTLQRICTHYEAGKRIDDPTSHRITIHSHLHSNDVLLRRWSLKALALISHPEDMRRIVDRLRVEDDPEALTWGAAGLLKRAGNRTLKQVSHEAGLEDSKALNLAARLYSGDHWIKDHLRLETISLNDDPLILKWAIFLVGYDRAPPALFSPRYENQVFLGELNQHSVAEIAEYSIWALWERPEFGFDDLRVSETQAATLPPNARKWAYRLLSTGQRLGKFSLEMMDRFRHDAESSAREGLALGLVDYCDPSFDATLLDWFEEESDAGISDVLLSVMAVHGERNADFADVVLRRYRVADPLSSLRPRLIAAVRPGTSLFGQLRAINARDQFARRALLEFGPQQLVFGDQVMGNKVSVTGNTQNIAGGDMIDSANASVQRLSEDHSSDAELLKTVLEALKKPEIPEDLKTSIGGAVEAYSKQPSHASKSALMSVISLGKKAFGGIAALAEIYLAASHLMGG